MRKSIENNPHQIYSGKRGDNVVKRKDHSVTSLGQLFGLWFHQINKRSQKKRKFKFKLTITATSKTEIPDIKISYQD